MALCNPWLAEANFEMLLTFCLLQLVDVQCSVTSRKTHMCTAPRSAPNWTALTLCELHHVVFIHT